MNPAKNKAPPASGDRQRERRPFDLRNTASPMEINRRLARGRESIGQMTAGAHDPQGTPMQTVLATLEKSDVDLSNMHTGTELAVDAQLMQAISRLAVEKIKTVNVGSNTFSTRLCAQALREKFGLTIDHEEERMEVDNDEPPTTAVSAAPNVMGWVHLGEFGQHQLGVCPSFRPLFGTFDPGAPPAPKERRKQQAKKPVGEAEKIMETQAVDVRDDTVKMINKIHNKMKKHFDPSDPHKTVGYFDVVLHPTSYARTVETMFCVSAMIKDGLFAMTTDRKTELPILHYNAQQTANQQQAAADDAQTAGPSSSGRRNTNEQSTASASGYRQWVVTIKEDEWRSAVQAFQITQPFVK